MMHLTRRSFLAGGVAALGGLLAPGWMGEVALGRAPKPYTRYNVNSAQGKAMLDKLANAVEIMKSGKYADCDPRSYTFQWFTHWTQEYQAFQYEKSTQYKEQYIQDNCTGEDASLAEAMWNGCQAHGVDNSDPEHFQEWFFPPWHRLYLYYFEQIVRYVLGDNDFSLPYWNPASGNVADLSIPAAFRDTSSPLYDGTRYSPINAGVRIDNVVLAPNWLSVNSLNEPLYIDSATGSFGFCPAVDINPHFLVHIGLGGDMSDGFNTVVKDPIFWVHHTNIDRLWESWNRLGGRKNPKDPKWLNRTFTWADANANPVKVPVSAATRVSQLGYQYDGYSVPPKPHKLSKQDLGAARQMPEVMVASASGGPILAPGAVVLPLPALAAEAKGTAMPLARRVEELRPGRQIYLVVKGLRASLATSAAYGIYFDLPKGARPSGGSDPHFVGVLPIMRGHAHGAQMAFNVTETLLKLNGNKMLGAKENTISIIPSGMPVVGTGAEKDLAGGASGTAIIEQIALVER